MIGKQHTIRLTDLRRPESILTQSTHRKNERVGGDEEVFDGIPRVIYHSHFEANYVFVFIDEIDRDLYGSVIEGADVYHRGRERCQENEQTSE